MLDETTGQAAPITTVPKFKTQPYRHQVECLNKFGRQPAFALLAEMGTGKTWIIINNVADLWSNGDCDAVLVLAPNGVHTNWTRLELPKHMPDWVRYKMAAWSSNPNRKEAEEMRQLNANAGSGELRILTMNWEALGTKRGLEFAEQFCATGRRLMLVADESDAVKNPSAIRTKNLMKLKRYSHWRRIMTGTPINNAPFDAFSQFNFLDTDILGTSSFYAFKAEYAEMLQAGNPLLRAIQQRGGLRHMPQIVARGAGGLPRYKNLDRLHALIAPHSFRVLKADCLDLPDKIYKTLVFNMTREQAEVYSRAEDECRLVFEAETTSFSKLVAVTKLAQITSGYYIHPASAEPVRIPGENPKLDLLVDRVRKITELGEKVIVWARYRIEIADITSRLQSAGVKCVQYFGGVKKADRVAAIESFEHGDAEAFIGNQQAGGRGITLVAAHYVIYFSNDFSLRNRLQSEDRAHRIGQLKNVTYFNIVAKGTIDEAVVGALENKKDVADAIVDRGIMLFKNRKVK